jgi:hypothetical protein
VTVTDDGGALLLPGYDHVQVRTNDRAMRRIAMLYPLLGGGWVVVSSAGAVDGSDDAVDSMITRVSGDGARLVFDGRLGWDGAHVAGRGCGCWLARMWRRRCWCGRRWPSCRSAGDGVAQRPVNLRRPPTGAGAASSRVRIS